MKYLNLTPFLRVAGLAILLAAANANATDGAAKPVEALDLYRLEQPLDPQLSPDGRTVAVLRQLRDIQTIGYAPSCGWSPLMMASGVYSWVRTARPEMRAGRPMENQSP